ncbi:MAG: efflux RND transporter periplasmic adaptor subunit [Ferruginibacter sp.]|nr:efflux RND transporter periplasmic adaptor subunit [Ferruginibacter sp.]
MFRKLFPQIIITSFFIATVCLLFSCTSKENSPAIKREQYIIPDSLMKILVMDTVKVSTLTNSIRFNGVIDFNTDKVAGIFPLVSGNVQDIKVMLGDYVKAGQTLGVVKSSEIANYNSALINTETNVLLTKRLLQQQRELYKSGLASQVDVTNAEVASEQAEASKVAAQRILSINGNNLQGEYLIKSPISGFIVQKNITNGMAIRSDNGNSLFTVSDLKEVWVQANVYEANIGKVHQGDAVEVSTISYPDRIFKGKIDKLMNVLDPANRVMKMRVVLSNPDYILKPQMFATVMVNNSENKNAVSINSSSLIFDHSQYYVLLYKNKSDVQITPVDIISINGSIVFIKGGVLPGDILISSQALQIYGALNE